QVRGRGLGRRALRLAGGWLLGACRLARVELLADPANLPVIHAAQAAGFAREGVLREYLRRRGTRSHVVVLSLIPTAPSIHPPPTSESMPSWRVKLPPGVRSPFEVYVNGVPQELGTDYRVSEGALLFERELVQQKLGFWAWFMGFWGVGTYKRNDEVDIRYEV